MIELLAELSRYARAVGVDPDRRYPYGYGTTRLTLAEYVTRRQVRQLHPEFLRRVLHLMVWLASKGVDYGIGGGSRDYDAQLAEALRRHARNPALARIPWRIQWWEGHRYWLRRGMAPYAFPGSSNHEEGATPDGAIAVDTVPATSWKRANEWVGAFGLKHFANVNSEPWHLQPAEWPNSRRDVDRVVESGGQLEPRPYFPGAPLPIPPEPPTLTEGIEPMFILRHRDYADQFLCGAGALHIGPTMRAQIDEQSPDLPVLITDDYDELSYVLAASGFDRDALIPLS